MILISIHLGQGESFSLQVSTLIQGIHIFIISHLQVSKTVGHCAVLRKWLGRGSLSRTSKFWASFTLLSLWLKVIFLYWISSFCPASLCPVNPSPYSSLLITVFTPKLALTKVRMMFKSLLLLQWQKSFSCFEKWQSRGHGKYAYLSDLS